MPARLEEDTETKKIQISASVTLLQQVDNWRRKQPDLPNLSEAIRRLILAGIAAGKARR